MTRRPSALRALGRPEAAGLRRNFLGKTHPVPIVSPTGIFLGMHLTYTVELERLFRVVGRIIRSLHYHEKHVPPPPDHGVVIASNETLNSLPAADLSRFRRTVIRPLSMIPIANGAFWYRFAAVENQGGAASAWGLTFYRSVSLLALTGPENIRSSPEHA